MDWFCSISEYSFHCSMNSGGSSLFSAASMAARAAGGRFPHDPDRSARERNFEASSVRFGS